MDTSLEVRGMLGIETETLPNDLKETIIEHPHSNLRTEINTIENFPKTNEQQSSHLSMFGMIIVIGVGIKYLNKRKNML